MCSLGMEDYSADLHLHTTFSDGTFSPQEVIFKSYQLKFNTIALTDHDVVDAIPIAKREAEKYNMQVIPGVELTIEWNEEELHLLGYYIEWNNRWFKRLLKDICEARIVRMKKMVHKLNELGIVLEPEEVLSTSERGAVGRLHLANVLYRKRIVDSPKQAFNKYIGNSGPCYVKKFRLSPKEAIKIILDLKGIPVIAHPGISVDEGGILKLVNFGLKGIEVYHPDHSKQEVEKYKELAKEYDLLITGGSDCHGLAKDRVLLGSVRIGKEIVQALKQARELLHS